MLYAIDELKNSIKKAEECVEQIETNLKDTRDYYDTHINRHIKSEDYARIVVRSLTALSIVQTLAIIALVYFYVW